MRVESASPSDPPVSETPPPLGAGVAGKCWTPSYYMGAETQTLVSVVVVVVSAWATVTGRPAQLLLRPVDLFIAN